MKHRKKIRLKYTKERVLFSDILPFEIPLIFSNRYFYRFMAKYQWTWNTNSKECIQISASKHKEDVDARLFAGVLFGCYTNERGITGITRKNAVYYPFQFNIAHKPNKNRTLSVIHPFNQLQVVNFYDKYKDSIIYLCNQSNYSLRKPYKVAQYFYYRDRLHSSLLGKKSDKVEMFFSEYESLKSYFSYREYSNIHKFYEDYRYQRAEKKFRHMLKMDLQSCFDSIYTHTITWAVSGGADQIKVLPGYKGSWLGDEFDNLMQSVNERETNGIIIGPEFSRIFAEIILQYIDKNVEIELLNSASSLINKKNYECYRYVDDYFLFYNDEKDKDEIIDCLWKWLKEFKLKINDSKTFILNRPFITPVTKAKIRINNLLNDMFDKTLWKGEKADLDIEKDFANKDNIFKDDNESNEESENINKETIQKLVDSKINLYMQSNSYIKEIKSIIDDCNIQYNDIANYFLEIFGRKVDAFLKKFDSGLKKLCRGLNSELAESIRTEVETSYKNAQKNISSFMTNIIDVAFFVYNSHRQVNTTLKLQKLINPLILYVRNDYRIYVDHNAKEIRLKRFEDIYRNAVLKKIQDELTLVLSTTDKHRNTLHESTYLLVLSKELGAKYMFSPKIMENFIYKSGLDYNVFICLILLYYYSNHESYKELKKILEDKIIGKYEQVSITERPRNAELTIMTADLMTCPFVDESFKKKILKKIGITKEEEQKGIIRFAKKQKYIFTRWTSFDLNKELQAKISQEVYS